MRLTISMKNSLVAAIFGDVPKVDYTVEITQTVRDVAFSLLPPEVRKLPQDIVENFINHGSYYVNGTTESVWLATDKDYLLTEVLRSCLEVDTRYKELIRLSEKQDEDLYAIKREITTAINSCNTDKQLVDRYPEFAKYLPTKNEISNLPTVPIVEHLRAAGWKG